MKTHILRLLAVLFVLMPGLAQAAGFEFKKIDQSVVRVHSVVELRGKIVMAGHGTGFVINDRGFIVTNQHVIDTDKLMEGIRKQVPRGVRVEFKGYFIPDGSFDNMRKATVVWSSADLDLAVLEVSGLKRPVLTLNDREPKTGADVWPVGFPGVAENFVGVREELLVPVVSKGVVSKMLNGGNPSQPATIRRLVQHDGAINRGNSGGPLFNACNQVIGINTFGPRTILPVEKDSRGNIKATGAIPTGVFFASFVGVLTKELKANGISFTAVAVPCVIAAGGETPFDIYIYIAIAAVLAGASMLMTLRKPRERVVRVVETYSQMLRRKDKRGGGGTFVEHAKDRAPAAKTRERPSGPGWVVSGFDGKGKALRFDFGPDDRGKGGKGLVIGRSSELSDFRIKDSSVSRRHARIIASGGGLEIEDLNSSNGTTVDGRGLKPYEPARLRPGADIVLGDVKLSLSKD